MIKIEVDLRSLFGPIRDQGQRPTCLAFAASDAHAALRGEWAPLSCEYLFYHAQRRANRTPSQGALLRSMLEALRDDGQPGESGWPYLLAPPADPANWIPPVGALPLFRRASEEVPNVIDSIVSELTAGRPVIVLMRLSWSFDWVKSDGAIDRAPNENPEPGRRHAVIAVGCGECSGRRVVLIRNSWGEGWGAGGYAWLTETYVQPSVFGLAFLKEDLSVPSHSAAA